MVRERTYLSFMKKFCILRFGLHFSGLHTKPPTLIPPSEYSALIIPSAKSRPRAEYMQFAAMPSPGVFSFCTPSEIQQTEIYGRDSANFSAAARTACASVESFLRNFLLAGTFSKRSRAIIVVPFGSLPR